MRELGKRIVRKLIYLLAVWIGISVLSFILANIAPTSPAEAYARRIAKAPSEEVIRKYNEAFGFDRSIPEQYVQWLSRAIHLDFGKSYATKKPVVQALLSVALPTFFLAGLSAILILIFAIPLGILAAQKEGGWIDRIVTVFSFLSVSIPGYFLGLLILMILGIRLRAIPIIGHGNLASTLCASFVLAFPMIGSLSRVLRSLLLENQYSSYVLYARARGVSPSQIMIWHMLRNAAPPCIILFGQNLGYLLAGTAIVENIFTMPGVGKIVLEAALNRDFPMINCYLVLMALCFAVFNMAAEHVGTLLNPKLTRESKS